MIPLIVASRNQKKVEELQTILTGIPVEAISLRDFPGAPEVVEDGKTFEELLFISSEVFLFWPIEQTDITFPATRFGEAHAELILNSIWFHEREIKLALF